MHSRVAIALKTKASVMFCVQMPHTVYVTKDLAPAAMNPVLGAIEIVFAATVVMNLLKEQNDMFLTASVSFI